MKVAKHFLMLLSLFVSMVPHAFAETISIGGSTTVQKYIKLAAASYSAIHPDIHFNIQGGGSSTGFGLIKDKIVHIGMMSRELTMQERNLINPNVTRHIGIALDAVVPVVSREVYESGIQRITHDALAQIYRGQITNWKQLGGFDRRIIVVDKNIYHGTRVVFSDYVLGSDNFAFESPESSVALDSDDDVIQLVKHSDQAIGYVGIAYLNKDIRVLSFEVDGETIKVIPANIRSNTCPMSRKLYLLVDKHAPDYVQNFIKYILSEKGQAIVKQAGYLPIQ